MDRVRINIILLWLAFVFVNLVGCSEIVYITGSDTAKARIEAGATGFSTDLSGNFQYCSEPAGYETSVCANASESRKAEAKK